MSLAKMAIKYDVDPLRKTIMDALQKVFPSVDYPASHHAPILSDLINVINNADSEEYKAAILLPSAYYYLAINCSSFMLFSNNEDIPRDVIDRAVSGMKHLTQEGRDLWRRVLKQANCSPSCKLAARSFFLFKMGPTHMAKDALFDLDVSFLDNTKFCNKCRRAMAEKFETQLQVI